MAIVRRALAVSHIRSPIDIEASERRKSRHLASDGRHAARDITAAIIRYRHDIADCSCVVPLAMPLANNTYRRSRGIDAVAVRTSGVD